MAREINLVPDIKNEMIKALKLRNYIFFACIVIAIASVVVTLIFVLISGGQRIAIESKKEAINELSAKLNSYSDLNDFLTIKNQLDGISNLTSNKQVLSRTFNILTALLPTGADTITISELNVNLTNNQPTLTFDAQANAGQAPFIDYNVLESFKKSMQYMRYDWGDYVDKDGNTIPAYCMIEQNSDGSFLNDGTKGLYAYWTIEAEGCNPSDSRKASDYTTEDYNGQTVVRIWRTPQYSDWYKEKESSNQPYMSLDGTIKNVEHFQSQCITYSGNITSDNSAPKWNDSNDCHLVAGSTDNSDDSTGGIEISDSSNGRDSSGELVLRFSAVIAITPDVYRFNNTHLIAIAPSGHRNVTDSYVQVQSMFGQRAADCTDGDAACNTNTNGGN